MIRKWISAMGLLCFGALPIVGCIGASDSDSSEGGDDSQASEDSSTKEEGLSWYAGWHYVTWSSAGLRELIQKSWRQPTAVDVSLHLQICRCGMYIRERLRAPRWTICRVAGCGLFQLLHLEDLVRSAAMRFQMDG